MWKSYKVQYVFEWWKIVDTTIKARSKTEVKRKLKKRFGRKVTSISFPLF